MHWTDEAKAQHMIASELQRRGWETYDFSPIKSDVLNDDFSWGYWSGLATHPDKPGIVLCVLTCPLETIEVISPTALAVIDPDEKLLPAWSGRQYGKTWHVESQDDVLFSGTLRRAIYGHDWDGEATAATTQFVDKIEQKLAKAVSK